MSHHLLLATWADSAKAFESFTKLKNTTFSHDINSAIIIERQADGHFKIQDQFNNQDSTNTLGGGFFGSLLGILGGPLGVLLGFSTGALIGSLFDADNIDANQAVLSKISQSLPVGSTGLFIDLEEQDESLVDALFPSDATLLRWDYDVVVSEVEASVAAWEEAQRIANHTLHEQKKAENKAKRQQKWADFRAKFQTH